jgi:hypothetical protein
MIKHVKNSGGQALVEFALVLGITLFLLLAIFEAFGLYRQRYGLDQVAREGARLAAEYGGGAPEVEAYIRQQLGSLLLDTADIKIEVAALSFDGAHLVPVTPARAYCHYGEFISVTVAAPWQITIPGAGLFVTAFVGDGIHQAEHIDKCWRGGS